jgi:hypothetical protein
VATRTLVDKIEALPDDERAEVEDFLDFLASRRPVGIAPASETGLVERLRARRERLLREHGLFDSLPILRELRDTGA